MLPDHLKKQHYEVDEDGRRHWHPGYMEKFCRECGDRFVVAKTMSDREVCGLEGNKHGKGKAVA